jgi:CheY-like chemotaxis protein
LSSQSLKVLAVDDEPLILMNLVDMLEDLGHKAVSAGSGQSAIAEMEKNVFDLLVTDQSMPNMTGADLIREAREKFPQIAVILATGYTDVPEETGGNVVRLGKPFSTEDLARALQQVRLP